MNRASLCVNSKRFVDLHRISQLQPLQHERMGHRFRLLWWRMVYLGSGPRWFCRFWCCTKYWILIFSVDYEDYSISSRGLFTILVNSIHLCLFETSLVAQTVKHLPTMWKNWVRSLGWEDPLEKKTATHPSTLAWKVLWTEDPGRLQSLGSHRVGHDWLNFGFSFLFILVHWFLICWYSFLSSPAWPHPIFLDSCS